MDADDAIGEVCPLYEGFLRIRADVDDALSQLVLFTGGRGDAGRIVDDDLYVGRECLTTQRDGVIDHRFHVDAHMRALLVAVEQHELLQQLAGALSIEGGVFEEGY